MTTFNDLRTGEIVTYNDTENVDLQFVILDTEVNQFGTFVNVMNLESRTIEGITSRTKIDGKRWSI